VLRCITQRARLKLCLELGALFVLHDTKYWHARAYMRPAPCSCTTIAHAATPQYFVVVLPAGEGGNDLLGKKKQVGGDDVPTHVMTLFAKPWQHSSCVLVGCRADSQACNTVRLQPSIMHLICLLRTACLAACSKYADSWPAYAAAAAGA
jgi:hypothetical protein